jgi:hypothetical protein
MSLPGTIGDREYQKFVETADGKTAVRVLPFDAAIPADYNNGTCTQLNATTHQYKFYKGVDLLRTINIVFAVPTPISLSSWVIS